MARKVRVYLYDSQSNGEAFTLRRVRVIKGPRGQNGEAFFPRNGGWRLVARIGSDWCIWAEPGKRFTCRRWKD